MYFTNSTELEVVSGKIDLKTLGFRFEAVNASTQRILATPGSVASALLPRDEAADTPKRECLSYQGDHIYLLKLYTEEQLPKDWHPELCSTVLFFGDHMGPPRYFQLHSSFEVATPSNTSHHGSGSLILRSTKPLSHMGLAIWVKDKSQGWWLVLPVGPPHQGIKQICFVGDNEIRLIDRNESASESKYCQLKHKLRVAYCLLAHKYLSPHTHSDRNDVLYLANVIDSINHHRCRMRSSQTFTVPLFFEVSLPKDEKDKRASVKIADTNMTRTIFEFMNEAKKVNFNMREAQKTLDFQSIPYNSVLEHFQTLFNTIHETLPPWASNLLPQMRDECDNFLSDSSASSQQSNCYTHTGKATASRAAPFLPMAVQVQPLSEDKQKSEASRPWASGVEWADDDTGWNYSILTEADVVCQEKILLCEFDNNVEKAYLEAVKRHRLCFRSRADIIAATLPSIRNIVWIGSSLNWRLEKPHGTYRFFSAEGAGVQAAWTRAVACRQNGRKRQRCVSKEKEAAQARKISKNTNDRVDRHQFTASPIAKGKESCENQTGSDTKAFGDCISPGYENRVANSKEADSPDITKRHSIATTKASLNSADTRSLSDTESHTLAEFLQAEATRLQPYPAGIIWARTTLRWFAIYQDPCPKAISVRRKKFRTFDPKKFNNDCTRAFQSAIQFLQDKIPWVNHKNANVTQGRKN